MAIIAVLAGVVAGVALRGGPTGDPGQLSEPAIELPAGVSLPELSDATGDWGLADFTMPAADDMMAGGVAVADLDGDLHNDLVIANGDVAVLRWSQEANRFSAPQFLGVNNAVAAAATDVDRDGLPDILIATANDEDLVFWGGQWLAGDQLPVPTELPASGPSSGLLAGELSGDGLIDIVRLGRGTTDGPEADILWVASPSDARAFTPRELPLADRFTLAGELVDVDADGLLDIWLTRDIGWARGGDSLLSRQGQPDGPWIDISEQVGVALRIDGMGITVADLNGDAVLDGYVSDLGDNEVLLGEPGGGFVASIDTGAAHIRPVGAGDDVVSSTWGTGATDVNLDGVVDLIVASGGFPTGTVSNKIDGTQIAVAEPPAVLLGVGDGRFVNVWSQTGIDMEVVARGMAVADLDGDGDDDFVIADRRGPVHIVRNDSTKPSLAISAGPGCPDLAGAIVSVSGENNTATSWLLAPHGYASSHGAAIIVGGPPSFAGTVALSGPAWWTQNMQVAIDKDERARLQFECELVEIVESDGG